MPGPAVDRAFAQRAGDGADLQLGRLVQDILGDGHGQVRRQLGILHVKPYSFWLGYGGGGRHGRWRQTHAGAAW